MGTQVYTVLVSEDRFFGALASSGACQYSLSVIPLFILMGNLVTRSGLSQELYHVSNAFLNLILAGSRSP